MKAFLIAFLKLLKASNPIRIVQNIYKNRYLISQMVKRDIGQRYRGSYLGVLWSIINPLLMLMIYTFVFSVVFKARWQSPSSNGGIGEYAITLFAGLIPFNLFSEVMNRAPVIVLNYPNYVKKVVFPLEVLVVVIVGTATITSFISLGILIVVNLILSQSISPTIVFLPLIFLPLQFLSLGLGWFLASLGVYIRDIGQGIAIVMQLLLFGTPVLYPATSIPAQYSILIKINPLAMIVTDFRNLLLWGQLFPIKEWIFWLLLSILLSIAGYVWFMGTKKGFPDVL